MADRHKIEIELYLICREYAQNATTEDVLSMTGEDEVEMTEFAVAFRRAFESYAILGDIHADTYSGDNIESELYDDLPRQNISEEDFSLWLWGNLS